MWTKLGDEFPDAARELSSDAFRTHVEALCWSNRRLLDLFIPKHSLKRFAECPDPEQAAKELVETGWWQDCGDGWHIGVHFADWQVESSVVEGRREMTAARVRRHRRHKAGDHSDCNPETCNALRDALPGSGRVGTGRGTTKSAIEGKEEKRADVDEYASDVPVHDGRPGQQGNALPHALRVCDRCGATPTRIDHMGSRVCKDCGPLAWRAA